MNQFLEAVGIALNAIWTNKLRSFLTVLGNIVAVTSIIAVVSVIQGMNAYVTHAIVTDVGADNFTIQRMPVVRSAEDEERVRSNPRISVEDGEAVRKFSDNINAVAAQANSLPASPTARVARRADPGRLARLRLLRPSTSSADDSSTRRKSIAAVR
jgi:putative ABC transport system permease protein